MTQSTAPQTSRPAPWIPDASTFGARLALIRQHMKWTNVAQAARECGVPADSWRNWEEGMEPRRLITIAMTIATRTGVDLDWLVYGPARAAAKAADPTNKYVPRDPLAARVVTVGRGGDVKHGDGRRRNRGAENITRPGERVATSTPRPRAVSQVATT